MVNLLFLPACENRHKRFVKKHSSNGDSNSSPHAYSQTGCTSILFCLMQSINKPGNDNKAASY